MDNSNISAHPQKNVHIDSEEVEINFKELFSIFWGEKKLIVGVTTFFAISSVIYALMLTNIYRAEAVLAPADIEQNAGGLASQFGGAAALLGVSVGSGGGDAISTAMATLRSRQFLGRFIEENGLLVSLFASRWDSNSRQSVIDESIYDIETGEWLLDNGPPSEQDAFRALSRILSISGPNRDTGIITVAIDWPNPIEAAEWVNKLVSSLNQDLRTRDVKEASNAIAYLQRQLVSTQLVDMQRVFYQLIESQTRITMLADVRDEYVLRVIDPAVVPDRRSAPQRSLIAILGTIAGGMLSLLIVFVRRIFRK
jgi:LPS O-antigen subunit length determinant protein (WzzB/FepE family)